MQNQHTHTHTVTDTYTHTHTHTHTHTVRENNKTKRKEQRRKGKTETHTETQTPTHSRTLKKHTQKQVFPWTYFLGKNALLMVNWYELLKNIFQVNFRHFLKTEAQVLIFLIRM